MKCTQCDSKMLTKIDLRDLFYVSGDASLQKSKSLEVYVCNECGHLEFFDNALNTKQKEEKAVVEKFDNELNVLIEKRDAIKNSELKKLTEELTDIEKQLTSLDITIRKQQELKQQVEEINAKIEKININTFKIDRDIKEVEEKKKCALAEVSEKYRRRYTW